MTVSGVNRILWNERPANPTSGGGDIDEIVVHDCTVHIEQMDDREWFIAIYPNDAADGDRWAGTFVADSRGRMRFVENENDAIAWDRDESHEDRR